MTLIMLISAQCSCRRKMASQKLAPISIDRNRAPFHHNFLLQFTSAIHELVLDFLLLPKLRVHGRQSLLDRFNLRNQQQLRLIATIFHPWSLVAIVQPGLDNLHRVVHVPYGHLQFVDLDLRVSQTLEGLESTKR